MRPGTEFLFDRSREVDGLVEMVKFGMVIDLTRCTGCYCCFAACKDEYWGNDYPPYTAAQPRYGHFWMNLIKVERGQAPYIKVAFMPVPCMQCGNPACIKAATDESVYKRADGVVIIDQSKATGQKRLLSQDACPYGVIYWNDEKQLPQKCAFCLHRIELGKQPRCVQACPSECIHFGDLSNPESDIFNLIQSTHAEVFHPEWGTKPHIYYIGLNRITSHFITGAVVFGDTDECAEGAEVVIERFDNQLVQISTNAFGNFESDGLIPGQYSIKIAFPGYEAQLLSVNLVKSLFLREIKLSRL
jgi:Fe-S-cluster-containing dehydrogenase component